MLLWSFEMVKFSFLSAFFAVFLSLNTCWGFQMQPPASLDQEKDFLLAKHEIIQRLGSEYRGNNFRFTEETLNREVRQREYLYDQAKKENPYQYPQIDKLFYKKRDLSDYAHRKYLDHDHWVRYTEKFMKKFDLNDYKHHLNFSKVPFSEIFEQFLSYERMERQKWSDLCVDIKQNANKYLLHGPLHPHKITGVDLLHERGITGEGAKAIVWDCGFVNNRYVDFICHEGDQIKYPENGEAYKKDDLHGTHVSGIIAAERKTGNKKGVAFGAEIQPVEYQGIPDLIERIKYSDTKVISASFHFLVNKGNLKELNLLAQELEKNDRLLIMAAGNDSKYLTEELSPDFYHYWFRGIWFGNHNAWVMAKKPDMFKRMLLVGSLREDGVTVSSFSNLPGVFSQDFVFAPGEEIMSTVAFDKFDTMSGTSMATPHVSGVLVLMNKYYPNLTALELKACLTKTCDPFWEDSHNKFPINYKADIYGLGRINAVRAFEEARRLSLMKQTIIDMDASADKMEVEAA